MYNKTIFIQPRLSLLQKVKCFRIQLDCCRGILCINVITNSANHNINSVSAI